MNDDYTMGDLFNAFRAKKTEKRQSNTKFSTDLLNSLGVSFVSNNGGAHLVIKHNASVIDFWPSTGLFIARGTAVKRRGVKNLLSALKVKQ